MAENWNRVLVVDDSKVYRELMKTLLRPHCRAVSTASGVAEAVEQLRDERGFDLVICDVVMDGDDGFSLLEHLRERGSPRLPVVMVTGRRSVDGVARARELGAAGYLEKPTTVRQIMSSVFAASSEERRSHNPRWRCNGTARLVDPDSGRTGPLVWDMYNISPSGAFLETKGPLPTGSDLHLALEVRGHEARARVRVVRVQEPTWMDVAGVGVEFVDPDDELRALIAHAIAEPRATVQTS